MTQEIIFLIILSAYTLFMTELNRLMKLPEKHFVVLQLGMCIGAAATIFIDVACVALGFQTSTKIEYISGGAILIAILLYFGYINYNMGKKGDIKE